MSRLNDLVTAIREEAARIDHDEQDSRLDMSVLLIRSIEKTMVEIKRGANSEDFQDLTVINLIIMGAQEKYTTDEMRRFINELKTEEDSEHEHDHHH